MPYQGIACCDSVPCLILPLYPANPTFTNNLFFSKTLFGKPLKTKNKYLIIITTFVGY
jgi:hypothetical protein